MGDRSALTEFWEKQAHSPTVETMMLNKFAEKVDEQDKRDILASLPILDGMRIVELGAGIGRFTPILAAKADHVIAADIVESFIEMNRKENGHMGNISFQTGEANAMKVEPKSINFLFTNWLLMYLTDAEVIRLLQNGLSWLNDGGYLHIRESCSEPSKRNAAHIDPNGLCQTDPNPTHYRHICQYLNLLNAINMHDEENNVYYKFRILWSKSVDTYIEAYGNWRQVQILVKKVIDPLKGEQKPVSMERLLKTFKHDTSVEQQKFESSRKIARECMNERSLGSKFSLEAVVASKFRKHPILVISTDDRLSISPHEISETFDSPVLCIETCPISFNAALAEAVNKQNKLVRIKFLGQLDSEDGEEWNIVKQKFDLVFGCCLVQSLANFSKFISHAKERLTDVGRFLFLEEYSDETSLKQIFQDSGCQNIVTIKDVTADFMEAAYKRKKMFSEKLPALSSFYESIIKRNKGWFVVEISL